MRTLDRLQITIEPVIYDPLAYSPIALQVTAIVNGERVNWRRELLPDHFASLFDVAFDEAKEKIKQAVLEQGLRVKEG
jgi:hypothetical protein